MNEAKSSAALRAAAAAAYKKELKTKANKNP